VNRKADFFLQNESIRIDSHNESNRIDSNRELECSIVHQYGHLILNTLSLKLNMFRDILEKD